jgi:hypothetical protein
MPALRDKPAEIMPDGRRIFARNAKGIPICYSTRAGGKGRCQSVVIMPNGRCKLHGGHAQAGMAHYNAKHLRCADNLPRHLQGDFNKAKNDPDLLSLDHELRLIDVQIAQQKAALETGLGAAAWKKLHSLADDLEYSLENEPERSEDLAVQMINVIRKGVKEREVWKEINNTAELRRRLADTGHKRERDLNLLLKADQAIALVTAMASICREAIAKMIIRLEARYILIERVEDITYTVTDDKGNIIQPKPRVDSELRLDFLADVSLALGKLMSKVRPTPPQDRDAPLMIEAGDIDDEAA